MNTLSLKTLGIIELYSLPTCISVYKAAVYGNCTISQIANQFSFKAVTCTHMVTAMIELNNALYVVAVK